MWDALDDSRDEALARTQGAADAGQYCTVKNHWWDAKEEHPRRVVQHQVYYLAHRDPRVDGPEDEATRELFTATAGDVTRAEARALMWNNRSARGKLMHRHIVSPSKGLGIKGVDDMQAWVRTCMERYAAHLGRDIQWVASIHSNTAHPHAHILIAGEAGVISQGGMRRAISFGTGDFKALRQIAVDAARPCREARMARELDAARERQAARMADLDRRLGIPIGATVGPTGDTSPPSSEQGDHGTPAPQAAPKRHWWQRGR